MATQSVVPRQSSFAVRLAVVAAVLAVASPACAQQSGSGGAPSGSSMPGASAPSNGMDKDKSPAARSSGTSGASGTVNAPRDMPTTDSTGSVSGQTCDPANGAAMGCGPGGVSGTSQSKGTTPSEGSSSNK
jgi:hypothetical protein